MKLYPSILTDSMEVAHDQLKAVASFEQVDTIQLDIVDGNFADNLTLTPLDLSELEIAEDLLIDFHLMTDEPMDHLIEIEQIKDLINVRAVIAQIERMSYQQDFITQARHDELLVGFSLDLYTPINAIDEDSWDHLDIIQLMGIEAGLQGQEFHPRVLKKIESLATIIRTRKQNIELIVDGGVKLENYQDIINAGADAIVVGSQIWKAPEPTKIISQFMK